MTIQEFQEKVRKFQGETGARLMKLMDATVTLGVMDISKHMEITDQLKEAAKAHGQTMVHLQSIVKVK